MSQQPICSGAHGAGEATPAETAAARLREDLHQPDLFERTIWLVQEIGGAVDKLGIEAPNLAARIRVARLSRKTAELYAASRDLGVLLASAAILTKTLEEQAKRELPDGGGQ